MSPFFVLCAAMGAANVTFAIDCTCRQCGQCAHCVAHHAEEQYILDYLISMDVSVDQAMGMLLSYEDSTLTYPDAGSTVGEG